MTVRTSVSFSDGLAALVNQYKARYPGNPINYSRIFQEALEAYLWEETGKRIKEAEEL